MRKQDTERIVFALLGLVTAGVVAILGILVFEMVSKGISALDIEFLTQAPRNSMTAGGIFPAIAGSFLLGMGSIMIAFPIGVLSAVYLSEYQPEGRIRRVINAGIANLAGVPSIVFGLFGFALFVLYLDFGVSLIAGSLTLALMILPTIIKTSQESIGSVPYSFREASLALGATKWQTVWNSVLPYAFPGILTGSILALSRAIGETAPIIFTAAVYFSPSLPGSVFDSVMALPYHLYILATQSINVRKTLPVQYGTALVLLLLVLGMNLCAILLRHHFRKKYRW